MWDTKNAAPGQREIAALYSFVSPVSTQQHATERPNRVGEDGEEENDLLKRSVAHKEPRNECSFVAFVAIVMKLRCCVEQRQ